MLTKAQKIAVLEGAKELLGPNGENWTKSCWWGTKRTDDEIDQWLQEQGFGPLSDLTRLELEDIERATDYSVYRDSVDPDKANVWCLVGALEESAWRLGITTRRETTERFAPAVSLSKLVESKEEWQGWAVIDVNDNPGTTWPMIRGLLDERLAQLKEEVA